MVGVFGDYWRIAQVNSTLKNGNQNPIIELFVRCKIIFNFSDLILIVQYTYSIRLNRELMYVMCCLFSSHICLHEYRTKKKRKAFVALRLVCVCVCGYASEKRNVVQRMRRVLIRKIERIKTGHRMRRCISRTREQEKGQKN